MRTIRITVEYDGTDFAGFQRQAKELTIQAALEAALRECLQHEVTICAAGRTDAGVHATGQVCRFRTDNRIPVERVPLALNRLLPRAIVIRAAREMRADWHPRYDATSRIYRYTIDNQPIPSALLRRYAAHVREPLDVTAMQAAARVLRGRHDFATFQATGSPMGSTIRELRAFTVHRRGGRVFLTVEANAFLYRMVRTLAGTLIQVGRGPRTVASVRAALAARDRRQAGPTAPACGLCLLRVKYDPVLRSARRRDKLRQFNASTEEAELE